MLQPSIPHYYLYGETSPFDELEFLHIEQLSHRSILFNWEITPHRHDNLFQIVFFEDGHLTAMIDTIEKHCFGSTIVSIPPTVVHGFSMHPNARGYVITVAESFLSNLFPDSEMEEFQLIYDQPSISQLDPSKIESSNISFFVKQLVNEYQLNKLGHIPMVGAYLKILLISIYRQTSHLKKGKLENSKQQKIFNDFRQLIEHNYKEHWVVKQYAEQLAVTENRLNRICRGAVDQSVSQIIHHRLLLEAKRNLVYTSLSVTEVAYNLGYKEPAYFSRFFTQHTGVPPREFRAKYKK